MSKFAMWSLAALFLATGAGAQEPAKRGPQKPKGDVTITRPRRARASTALLPGLNARGELHRWDPLLDNDRTPYEVWSYSGTKGELLTVTMRSTRVDSYLMVLRDGATGLETVAEDDDGLGAGTMDAGLRVTLPADGEYIVLANAAATLGPQFFFGPYSLEVVSSRNGPEDMDWAALYPGGGRADEKYAVVVGISDYPGSEQDLVGPRQDAAMFRDVLVRRYGFKEQNVVTLTDRNGTRGQVINAFRRFLFQAGPNGTVVFYFSGKGTLLDGRSGIDGSDDPAHDGRNEALYVWANAAEEKGGLILDDELGVLANELRAGRVLIVLDACYSGTATGGGAGAPKLAPYDTIEKVIGQPAAFLGTRKGQQADLPAGHILLSASRDNEVAWTSNDWPTRGGLASVFTYYLVDAMQRAGAGTTVEELMVTVGDSTNAYSRARHGKTQRPQAEGGRIGESLAEYLGE